MDSLKIFSGRSNEPLAQAIAQHLKAPLGEVRWDDFASGDSVPQFGENIRDDDVFIIQSTYSNDQHNHWWDLLEMLDAAKRASAGRITVVAPFLGKLRQDRKDRSRRPISARLIADVIKAAGTFGGTGSIRLLTVDTHKNQVMGFFDFPNDHLYMRPVFVQYIQENASLGSNPEQIVIVSPDGGAIGLAQAYAERLFSNLELPIIIGKKTRPRDKPNAVKELRLFTNMDDPVDLDGKTVLIPDDMIDTGGTLIKIANMFKGKGVARIVALATHPIFSNNAWRRLCDSSLDLVLVSDSIPLRAGQKEDCAKIHVVSMAPLLAEAIRRTHKGESISSLFEQIDIP